MAESMGRKYRYVYTLEAARDLALDNETDEQLKQRLCVGVEGLEELYKEMDTVIALRVEQADNRKGNDNQTIIIRNINQLRNVGASQLNKAEQVPHLTSRILVLEIDNTPSGIIDSIIEKAKGIV